MKPKQNKQLLPIIILSAAALYLLGLGVSWRFAEKHNARVTQRLLERGVQDITNDILFAVDDMLFYVGNAIVRHYGAPEKANSDSVREIMHRYDLDELNIVNSNGVVLAGDLANVGWDFHSNEKAAEFLRLLKDDRTYSQPFRAAIEDKTIVRKYAGVAFPKHDGFVQIGFDQKRLDGDIDYRLEDMTDGWSIGKAGYFIIAKRANGEIVSSGYGRYGDGTAMVEKPLLSEIGFDVLDVPKDAGKVFQQRLYGEMSYCMTALVGEYHRVLAVLPKEEVDSNRNVYVLNIALILFAVLLVAIVASVHLVRSRERLEMYIAETERHRKEELETAKTIQVESLPPQMQEQEDYSIDPRMITAKEVGGDFYDYFTAPSGKVFFLIADTSGKGIPAAMFMMKAKATLKAVAVEIDDFVAAITEANNRLAENNDTMMFVTAWIGLYDRETREIEFVNCGHNPPLVRRADGSVEWIKARTGLALAAMGGMKFRSERIRLNSGDTLFLYTDGVTEAIDATGPFYGQARLEKTIAAAGESSLTDRVIADVFAFSRGAEQADDITLLSLKVK